MNRFEITASAPDKKAFSLLHYTKTDGIPTKQGIALWACDDCKTEVVGNHAVLFSCPCCTKNMKAGATAEMTAAELDNAHHIGDCTFCGSVLVSAADATAQFKDKNLYCPVCSETVALADDAAMPDMSSDKDAAKKDDTSDLGDGKAADDADLPEGEDESDDDDTDSSDDSDDAADDEESADDESADDAENDETDTSDDTADKSKKTTTAADDSKKSDDSGSGDDDDGGDDSDDEDDSSSDDEDDSEDGDDSDSSDDETDDKKDKTVDAGTGKGDTLQASLLAAVSGKNSDVDIIQSPDRSRWYLFADKTPVAISEAARCAENLRSVFSTNQFATAFTAATDEGVTEDVLEEFGFEPVTTNVTVDEAVRQNVEAQIQEKTAKLTMTAAAYGDRFQQCFGMASAALPKRFFKDDRNPVEKSLIATLEKVGVRDAANLVTRVFAQHGKTLYKTLVLRANDLMEKDDKTLEEIAKLIDDRESTTETEEKTPSKPIAAFASMEEEPVQAPKVVLASDSQDDDVFANYFQRKR